MLILQNVQKLYDGTSDDVAAIHEGVDVLIRDGRIHEIRPHASEVRYGEDHDVVEASGLTVVPGLVDGHGHVTLTGIRSEDHARTEGAGEWVFTEKVLYTTLVDGGVTTMRDVGGATHRMKRLIEEGLWIGPRLKIAICMLSTTGGHADFRGPDRCHATISSLWPEGPGRPSSIVDGPWECRKRVREIAASGADLVKLCTSPGVASPGDRLEHRDFTAEEIRAICDEAEGRGLRVAAHAHSRSGIRLAVENGVHDIQHISFMDEDLVEAAYARDCTVTPTSWVVADLPDADGLSPFVRDKAKQVAEVHARAVDFARRGGLRILAGTDPVLPGMHGRNYMEVVHLVRDGLPPLQAWFGATGLAAREIGQTDAGTLVAGQRADLLLCRGDVVTEPGLLDAGALLEVLQDGVGHRGFAGIVQRGFDDTVRRALAADAAS